MSALDSGFRYPDIVRAGIQLVLDPPADFKIRVDPDGERKVEEHRRRNQEWRECKRASGIHDVPRERIRPLPKLKTIHLQWLDTSYVHAGYEAVWRDANLHIDLDRRRLYDASGGVPFLSRGHQGSGAIGVMIFAAPVLLAISPYLYVRARLYGAKERKHGMSRHGIVLLEKLKGQLDAESEALLREALKNEWARHLKLDRRVSFEEAGAALDACALTERRHEPEDDDAFSKETLEDFSWFDDQGDMIGHAQFVDGRLHFARVLGSMFEEAEARALTARCRTRRVVEEGKEED